MYVIFVVPSIGNCDKQAQSMKKKLNWPRIIYIAGIVGLLAGILDPLEGSLVIVPGSLLLAVGAFMLHKRFRKIYLASAIMIAIGVAALFYLSSLGGFGGTSSLSWWWGVTILPYPIGWLLAVIFLIIGARKQEKEDSPAVL
jgi:hypothetical protein